MQIVYGINLYLPTKCLQFSDLREVVHLPVRVAPGRYGVLGRVVTFSYLIPMCVCGPTQCVCLVRFHSFGPSLLACTVLRPAYNPLPSLTDGHRPPPHPLHLSNPSRCPVKDPLHFQGIGLFPRLVHPYKQTVITRRFQARRIDTLKINK